MATNCGFNIPVGGTLGEVHLTTPLEIASGGTGASTVAGARNALGLGNTADALPIANGGTGSSTAQAARNALGIYNGITSVSGLSASNPVEVAVSFNHTFVNDPSVTVTPATTAAAINSYGIYIYIRSLTKTGFIARLTTNVTSASTLGTVYVYWMAIGD